MREAEPSRVCLGGFIILKSLLADAVTGTERTWQEEGIGLENGECLGHNEIR
jgi:hypothetical protein